MAGWDIVALGESLIDVVIHKAPGTGRLAMEGTVGGAPANVLAMAARLGRKTSMISKVGRDAFGEQIRSYFDVLGIDCGGMVNGSEPTTLAIVTLDDKGERSFQFYGSGTADGMLQSYEVDPGRLTSCKLFHFGALSLAQEPARTTTLQAATRAKAAGARVSFDPNYRPARWQNEAAAAAEMQKGLELADYVKLSGREAQMLSGMPDPEKGAAMLQSRYHFAFLAVTLGAEGCVGISPAARVRLPAHKVKVVDTTGAGDAFMGTALHQLLQIGSAEIGEARLVKILRYASAAGALSTTKPGAIVAQPSAEEIEAFVQQGR